MFRAVSWRWLPSRGPFSARKSTKRGPYPIDFVGHRGEAGVVLTSKVTYASQSQLAACNAPPNDAGSFWRSLTRVADNDLYPKQQDAHQPVFKQPCSRNDDDSKKSKCRHATRSYAEKRASRAERRPTEPTKGGANLGWRGSSTHRARGLQLIERVGHGV